MDNSDEIGEKEAELYDRQLRLWGFEAQRRMQKSKILICGASGLHVETAKNLILAGINVTVQDSGDITAEDLSSIYFANSDNIGQNRATVVQTHLQALNAYVSVESETMSVADLSDDYFARFCCIMITGLTNTAAFRLNTLARSNGASFFLSNSYGDEGWFISDLGSAFTFQHDPPRSSKMETFCYPSLCDVLSTKWKDFVKRHFPLSKTFVASRIISEFRETYNRLPGPSDTAVVTTLASSLLHVNGIPSEFITPDDVLRCICLSSWGQLMPVCSVVGGFLSQEVVKAVSAVGVPMMNVFVFSLLDGVGKAFCTAPDGTTVATALCDKTCANVNADMDMVGEDSRSSKKQRVEVEVL